MTTYVQINGVHSDTEPTEEMKYGANGIDYCINIQKVEDGYTYDILRFNNEADYIRYRKING